MGSRAEIVVIDGGIQRKYYTHWGGESLHLDLLPGPGAAVRFATAQRPEENWVYDLEAAAVIDIDQRMLLWYSATCKEDAIRAAVFETMLITWPEWRVHWAGYGDMDLVDYCDGRWPQCVVGVKTGDRARLYMPAVELTTLLEMGPALVETIAGWQAANRIPTLTEQGLYLDPERRSGVLWSYDGSSGGLELIAAQWPGWTWENRDRECEERMAAAGAAVEPVPELPAELLTLSESFDRHQVLDAGTEGAATLMSVSSLIQGFAGTAGLTLEAVEDNTFTHRPIELTAAELSGTREAITAVKLRVSS